MVVTWQQFCFWVSSFMWQGHFPFLGFTNIIHSLVVNEETYHNRGVCFEQDHLFLIIEAQMTIYLVQGERDWRPHQNTDHFVFLLILVTIFNRLFTDTAAILILPLGIPLYSLKFIYSFVVTMQHYYNNRIKPVLWDDQGANSTWLLYR